MAKARQLRFTLNDGDTFPMNLNVESLKYRNDNFPLSKKRIGDFVWGVRLNDEPNLRKVEITLSQYEQVISLDETICIRHLGHALLIQKGHGDNQTIWFDGINGFPPAILITHGMRQHTLQDGKELFIYVGNEGDNLTIMLPTKKVHFRISKMWKAEVIG